MFTEEGKKKSVFITIFSIIFYSKTLLYDKATRLTYIIYFATVIWTGTLTLNYYFYPDVYDMLSKNSNYIAI